MPKMKTKRAALKRFSITKSGKVKFKRGKKRHILTKKSSKFKLQHRGPGYLKDCDTKHARECLPYA